MVCRDRDRGLGVIQGTWIGCPLIILDADTKKDIYLCETARTNGDVSSNARELLQNSRLDSSIHRTLFIFVLNFKCSERPILAKII